MTERAKDPGAEPVERRDPMLSGGVDAVLLLGRNGHQGAAGEGMEFLAEAVRATGRYLAVHTATAERGLASLPEGLEVCARAGARRILVVPVFLGRDRSLIHWLSKAAYRWSRARGEPGPEVVFTGAIGEHPALGEAVVRAVAGAEGEAPVHRARVGLELFGRGSVAYDEEAVRLAQAALVIGEDLREALVECPGRLRVLREFLVPAL